MNVDYSNTKPWQRYPPARIVTFTADRPSMTPLQLARADLIRRFSQQLALNLSGFYSGPSLEMELEELGDDEHVEDQKKTPRHKTTHGGYRYGRRKAPHANHAPHQNGQRARRSPD